MQWQAAVGPAVATPTPTITIYSPADHVREDRDYELIGETYRLQYAYELRACSYGPGPIPLALHSLLAFPPDFVSTDLEARRFVAAAETVKFSPFGIAYMVRNLASLVFSF